MQHMESNTIRVAIFEDNDRLRESLKFLIDGTPGYLCCGAFPDCNRLSACIEVCKPDVVLMDIELPGMNGIEAVAELRRTYPEVQVLMQTIFQDDDNIFRAVCAGASGYILKSTPPAGYLEAISDVYGGGSPMTSFVARRVLELFSKHLHIPSHDSYQLTGREIEILQLLAKGKSYKQIASDLGLAFETIRTHMKRIYAKLHVNSNTEAVSKVINERII